MKELREIELKFNRKDFEEVYFDGHSGNYFKSEATKVPLQYSLIFGLIFLFLLYYAVTQNSVYILTIFTGIVFTLYLIQFLIEAMEIWKKRKILNEYMDDVEKIKSHKLILTEDYFELIQENEKVNKKWSDFKSADLNSMYVYLLSEEENFLIPQKSMTISEFNNLTAIITEKIK